MSHPIDQFLAVSPRAALPSDADDYYAQQERRYRHAAMAPNTARSYLSALRAFARWAGIERPFPASTAMIKRYLIDHAEQLAPSTLKHHLAALSYVHRYSQVPDPTRHPEVQAIVAGVTRSRRQANWVPGQARSLSMAQLQQVIATIDIDTPRGVRDRAVFLVGLVCAFRQSELCALRIEDLKRTDQGYVYRVRQAKNNPDGEHKAFKVIPIAGGELCPVAAIERLCSVMAVSDGALFRGLTRHGRFLDRAMTHPTVNRIIRQRIAQAGVLDAEASLDEYSFHSLRASFITILRGLDVHDAKIVRQTHHQDLNTLNLYDRPDEQLFEQNPAVDLIALLNAPE